MYKINTVLFDLNGVLILDASNYTFSDLENNISRRMGLSLNDIQEKEKIKEELGWSEQDFWNFVNKGWHGAVPNMDLIRIIVKLKRAGYKTGIISNTSGIIIRQKLNDYFGVPLKNLFDLVLISSEVGLLKPDVRIFDLALEKLQANPKETLFIDDAESYLTGAQKIGMHTLLFTNTKALAEQMLQLGISLD